LKAIESLVPARAAHALPVSTIEDSSFFLEGATQDNLDPMVHARTLRGARVQCRALHAQSVVR
jgi:hypothetical protein